MSTIAQDKAALTIIGPAKLWELPAGARWPTAPVFVDAGF